MYNMIQNVPNEINYKNEGIQCDLYTLECINKNMGTERYDIKFMYPYSTGPSVCEVKHKM